MNSETGYYNFLRSDVAALISTKATTILDIGCGNGILGASLKQRQSVTVWGIECVAEAAVRASACLDRVITARVEDGLSQLPEGFFDTIVCADVLEHLENPWEVLSQLRAKLSGSGELVVSLPNVRHWSVIKGLLEGKWIYTPAGILDWTHLRFFTRESILEMFRSTGYQVTYLGANTHPSKEPVPQSILAPLAAAGIDVTTLLEEGAYYQYFLKCIPCR